jgi:hypothetical protein
MLEFDIDQRVLAQCEELGVRGVQNEELHMEGGSAHYDILPATRPDQIVARLHSGEFQARRWPNLNRPVMGKL